MTKRNPIVVFILAGVTFGIYGLYWLIKTREEMVNLGADIPPWIFALIPVLNLLFIWKYCQGIEKVTNGDASAVTMLILFMIGIGVFVAQGKFNEVGGGAAA